MAEPNVIWVADLTTLNLDYFENIIYFYASMCICIQILELLVRYPKIQQIRKLISKHY